MFRLLHGWHSANYFIFISNNLKKVAIISLHFTKRENCLRFCLLFSDNQWNIAELKV